jgi:hypothetical protein
MLAIAAEHWQPVHAAARREYEALQDAIERLKCTFSLVVRAGRMRPHLSARRWARGGAKKTVALQSALFALTFGCSALGGNGCRCLAQPWPE